MPPLPAFVIFLVGPTGVGKSAVAIQAACRIQAEIISADSMQIYRRMDIGTAKPSVEDQRLIPHHLIDILDPSEPFSSYEFRERALAAIRDIHGRGRIPLVVGGTGFYVQNLIDGIAEFPDSDKSQVRLELERRVQTQGLEHLYQELSALDPARAQKIHPHDQKRITRALEIYSLTGKQPSQIHEKRTSLIQMGYESMIVGLTMEREALYQRIDQRVDRMMAQGFLNEVARLAQHPLSLTASQAVGYKEALEAFKNQEFDQTHLAEQIKRNTRRLAKRQWTWFKRVKGIQWLMMESHKPQGAADHLVRRVSDELKKRFNFYLERT